VLARIDDDGVDQVFANPVTQPLQVLGVGLLDAGFAVEIAALPA
jgi:hypothetical protein